MTSREDLDVLLNNGLLAASINACSLLEIKKQTSIMGYVITPFALMIIQAYRKALIFNNYSKVIIGEDSPRRRPSLRRIIVLVFLHKSCVFFGTEFILISLIFLSVTSTKQLAANLKISVLLYSLVGNSLIRQI